MPFRFKQFSIVDERSAMKVGTDAVLLGCWAGNAKPANILDIGTGCGLISLMLAQRFPDAKITGIDIHSGSLQDANENFRASEWNSRLGVKHISLQEYAPTHKKTFDLIVSNPPFFINSLLPPGSKKKLAKHSGELSFQEVAEASAALLKPEGSLALILPYENREIFKNNATRAGLSLVREIIVHPVRGKTPNRYLSEWGFIQKETVSNELHIRDEDHNYTRQYIEMTREFYLAL